MTRIFPFRAWRYSVTAGAPLEKLVTQPYDKITAAMREAYLAASPYNLVRVILGKPEAGDNDANNIYTRAAAHFRHWLDQGILVRDNTPAFYPYFQEFTDPDTGDRLTRKGFIGVGQVEDYAAGIVHRHEQTLSGPKKDRLQVLRHTGAHFGQIFMLYPDQQGAVDAVLDQASLEMPLGEVTDEYGVVHRLWRITHPETVERVQQLMSDKKLVIADGHHRYETALNFRGESTLEDARRVMMTFVNMHSPGLRILPTHRIVRNLERFDGARLLAGLRELGVVTSLDPGEARRHMAHRVPNSIVIGAAIAGDDRIHVLEASRAPGDLDVRYLHRYVLEGALAIGEEAVREEKYLKYVRGFDAAVAEVREHGAQAAFLLQPTRIEDVAAVSFSGGVMPQKSTDFYPKLLTGLTIYRLER